MLRRLSYSALALSALVSTVAPARAHLGTVSLASLPAAKGFRLSEENTRDQGGSDAVTGDFNGDGYLDLAVADKGWDPGNSGTLNGGRVYVFYGPGLATASLATADAIFQPESTTTAQLLGSSLAAIDMDGDGDDELFMTAPSYNANRGVAYVIFGGTTLAGILPLADIAPTSATVPGVRLVGANAGDGVGIVAAAGDVNGDGYGDVLVGQATGFVSLIRGGPTFATTKFTASSHTVGAVADFIVQSGSSRCAGVGDLDHDGYADFTAAGVGVVYLVYGSPTQSGLVTGTAAASAWFTAASAGPAGGAGDVNGDGYDDLLLGAFDAHNGTNAHTGTAFLYNGSAVRLSGAHALGTTLAGSPGAAACLTGLTSGDFFGATLAGVGDINRDGYDDIMVGAYGQSFASTDDGAAYLVYGASQGIIGTISASKIGTTTPGAAFKGATGYLAGYAVHGARDFNADGFADLLIGAPGNTGVSSLQRGLAFVVYGEPVPNMPVLPFDSDHDGVDDNLDRCPGFDDRIDVDGDGTPNGCDRCPLDRFNDSDGDGACDSDDRCPLDAANDLDGDGLCSDVDTCPRDPANDADGDLICGDVDLCPLDAANDADGDGACANVDICPGSDDRFDVDADGVPDGCDICPLDAHNDSDGDGLCDSDDGCPLDPHDDSDGDSTCDSDDACPHDPANDADSDGICGDLDLCPNDAANDADADGACADTDICPGSDDRIDGDGDGVPNGCDVCPRDFYNDSDADGACDSDDRCPLDAANDSDGDGSCDSDDACPHDPDNDVDADHICGDVDLCPLDAANDADGDGSCADSDLCAGSDDHIDTDGDGVPDGCDVCPRDAHNDSDSDGACDSDDACPHDAANDSDGDGSCDSDDTCPHDAANDLDADGICGDIDSCPRDAANDADGDGICESADNCPTVRNVDQANADGDAFGNLCEADNDGDGVIDDKDNCPFVANPTQADRDADGLGDACDPVTTTGHDDDDDGDDDDHGEGDHDRDDDHDDDKDHDHDGRRTNSGGGQSGCSVDATCSVSAAWKNHGAYVSCVAQATTTLVEQHRMTATQRTALVRAATQSNVGNKKK